MLPPVRTLIVLALAALALAACGRRGGLQPPGGPETNPAGPRAPASARSLPTSVGMGEGVAAPDAAAVQAGDELSPSAVPVGGDGAPVQTGRGARRGYVIPKQPFILDPLL